MTNKLVIFDLDGTLTNTLDTIAHFLNSTLREFSLPEITTDQCRMLVGTGAKNLVTGALRLIGERDEDGSLAKRILAHYSHMYNADSLYKTTIYDGINELIGTLKESGVKLAVLSNKPHKTTCLLIEQMFPKGTFDCYYGAREGVPLKPDFHSVNGIIKELGANSADCYYVGDTRVDIQTGKNANLYTIGVLWGFRDMEELTGADLIVSHPKEIEKAVLAAVHTA